MSKKNITTIALYSFVLVVAIAVILFVDKRSKERYQRAPLTKEQAITIIKRYYPELGVSQSFDGIEDSGAWYIVLFEESKNICFKVTADNLVYKTGESMRDSPVKEAFNFISCKYKTI